MQFSFYNGTVVHCENVWVNTGTHWVPSFHLGLGHLVQSMQITALGWVTRPKQNVWTWDLRVDQPSAHLCFNIYSIGHGQRAAYFRAAVIQWGTSYGYPLYIYLSKYNG